MAKTQPATKNDTLGQRLAAIAAHPDSQLRKQFAISLGEKAIDEVARTVRFTITTEAVDRDNDTIRAAGWDLANYLKSPVVLWAHDYSALPVARAADITVSANGLESTAQFPPKGVYSFADTVFDLVKGGFLNATSVGFRPLEYSRDDERGGINFQRQELLEYSIVPVPANPEALSVARSKGIDVAPLTAWAKAVLAKGDMPDTCSVCGASLPEEADSCPKCGAPVKVAKDNADGANGSQTCPQCHVGSAYYDGAFCQACGYAGAPTASAAGAVAKGVSPSDVSMEKADEGASWSAPSLKDILGDTTWDQATAAQKRKAAGYFAWAAGMPPATFGDCKLPHHDPKVVWRGVAAAAARMNQAQIPSADDGKVKAHLAKHYRQFDKTPPWVGNASAWSAYAKAATGKSDLELFGLLTLAGFTEEAAAIGDDARKSGNPDIGETLTEPAVVPPPGTATGPLCPACGAEYDEAVCAACGWQAPTSNPASGDEHPMTAPARSQLLADVEKVVKSALVVPELTSDQYVERAVAVAKRGRVLSAANESRIRQAQEHLSAVLAKLDQQAADADGDGDGDKSMALALRVDAEPEPSRLAIVDDEIVMRFATDAGDEPVTQADIKAALDAALAEALGGIGSMVGEQVSVALARARGRVD